MSKSRRQRCADAISNFQKAMETSTDTEKAEGLKDAADEFEAELEGLKDELQSWLDNMPESLQQSAKAEELQTAIDQLEEAVNALGSITNDQEELEASLSSCQEAIDAAKSVEFPGMR